MRNPLKAAALGTLLAVTPGLSGCENKTDQAKIAELEGQLAQTRALLAAATVIVPSPEEQRRIDEGDRRLDAFIDHQWQVCLPQLLALNDMVSHPNTHVDPDVKKAALERMHAALAPIIGSDL